MKRQIEVRAQMIRRGLTYKGMARELRGRGLDVEESDVLAVVNGRRVPDAAFKTAAAAVLGKPTFELFS